MASAAWGRRTEGAGTFVAEEVVAGKDVVDLEALRAGEALADVALKERFVAHHPVALSISEEALGGRAPAGLAAGSVHLGLGIPS